MPDRLPYPSPTSTGVTAAMKGNRKTDTRPELALRSALHRMGLRFRKNARVESAGVRADIIFRGACVAVFVDGCFWHQCTEHGTSPRSNASYWRPKLERNVARDRQNDAALERLGWRVIRVWEHEDPSAAAVRIAAAVEAGRMSLKREAG